MNAAITQLFNLEGRTALVTGGSRGLGLQIAEALGQAGARVLLSSRKAGDLEEATAVLKAKGVEARWVAADASNPEDARRVVAETMEHFGKIDILVNNAGATWGAAAEEHPLAAWDKVMNLNIRSLFVISQAVAQASMIPNRYGRILNIASIAGLAGNTTEMKTIAYNTSKGAVVNFTRALAGEWGEHGITVNAIAPGFFPSKMSNVLIEKLGKEKMINHAPLRRLGGEQDLQGAALLFASAAGQHITGQILAVDGGVSAILAG